MLPSRVSWSDWGRMFTETSLWESPIRHVLSGLGFLVHSIEAGYPGTSAVFRVRCDSSNRPENRCLIVKFYPPMAHRDFVAEESVYRALSPSSPLPIPKLVAAGTLHDAIDWPYLVLEESRGTAVRDLRDELTPEDLADIAEQVGVHLRALHNTDRTLVPELNRSVDEWKAWATSRLEAVPEELAGICGPDGTPYLPVSTLEELEAFLRSTGLEIIASITEGDLSLIHGDVTEDHVLVVPEEAGGNRRYRVETIFDFGDSEVAPVFYEWIPVWFSLLRQDRRAFAALLRGYRRSPARGFSGGTVFALGELSDGSECPGVETSGRNGTSRFTQRDVLLTYTFIHRFSAAIIREKLIQENVPPGKPKSLRDLADILWPH